MHSKRVPTAIKDAMTSSATALLASVVISSFLFIAPVRADDEAVTTAVTWGQTLVDQAATDEEREKAVTGLIEKGAASFPALGEALATAQDDERRTDITYAIATILAQPRLSDSKPVHLPPELALKLGEVLSQTQDVPLQANIANIAAFAGIDAAPMAASLMQLLRQTSEPNLRATTQFALGATGEAALPLLYETIKTTDDDRLAGDIALILRGSDLPDDVRAAIEKLLKSDNAEARQYAILVLKDSSPGDDALIEAQIANLEAADTDNRRVINAGQLMSLEQSTERVVNAFAKALTAMEESNQRIQLAHMLAANGPKGMAVLAKETRAAISDEVRADLVEVLSARAIDAPDVIDALIVSSFHTENPETRRNTTIGLIKIGKPAVEKIDAALADTQDPEIRAGLENALSVIRSRP